MSAFIYISHIKYLFSVVANFHPANSFPPTNGQDRSCAIRSASLPGAPVNQLLSSSSLISDSDIEIDLSVLSQSPLTCQVIDKSSLPLLNYNKNSNIPAKNNQQGMTIHFLMSYTYYSIVITEILF